MMAKRSWTRVIHCHAERESRSLRERRRSRSTPMPTSAVATIGILRLRGKFVLRTFHSAQDDRALVLRKLEARSILTPPSPTSPDSVADPRRSHVGLRCDTPAAAAERFRELAVILPARGERTARGQRLL